MRNLGKFCITTIASLGIMGTAVLAVSGSVNAPSGLVLRSEASKSGAPLATVPDKTEVEVVEESGEWYKVRINGQEWYLFKEYVVNVPEIQKPEKPEVPDETKPAENERG